MFLIGSFQENLKAAGIDRGGSPGPGVSGLDPAKDLL
jgi:hypothetical protein